MKIVGEDHHLSFLKSKNVSVEWWQKLDKTVVKAPDLRNQVTYITSQQHTLASGVNAVKEKYNHSASQPSSVQHQV